MFAETATQTFAAVAIFGGLSVVIGSGLVVGIVMMARELAPRRRRARR